MRDEQSELEDTQDTLPPRSSAAGTIDSTIDSARSTDQRDRDEAHTIASGAHEGGIALASGVIIGDDFELIRELGRGGMGAVFLARDLRLGRRVAIKFLAERSQSRVERFLAEARATARCEHENIVVIHHVGALHGQPYMVLEHVEGLTLREWIRLRRSISAHEHGPAVSPARAVELIVQVVRALSHAHGMGIVHRDLKPANIVLSDTGAVKVLDFGIARSLPTELTALMETTASERPAGASTDPGTPNDTVETPPEGTPPYMSPEQLVGGDVDPRSDLWAIGIMLWELVTGAHPLAPLSMARLMTVADMDRPMPRAQAVHPHLGPLAGIIDRCLAKRSDERYQSADELLAELEPLLVAGPAPAPDADDNPFAGLAAFQEHDAARFFGRGREVASTMTRLRNHRLVTVAGPSGAGKSSFVRAGLIPSLKRSGDRWEAFVLRPGRRPLAALAALAVDVSTPDRADDSDQVSENRTLLASQLDRLRSHPGELGARLRARCRHRGQRALVFVDQFEELYTMCDDPDERARFADCLQGIADDEASPLRVVLAVRSDFIDRIADDRHLLAEVSRGLVLLPALGRAELRDALTLPFERAGFRFERDDMVEGILDALATTRSPLPLLQFAAARLWERRDRDSALITAEGYEQIGGIAGALAAHADAVMAGLSARERRLARALFLRLVTPERKRAIVSMAELRGPGADGAAVAAVARTLADARLVLIETDGSDEAGPGDAKSDSHGAATVELVHESLIDRWPRLRRWLDAHEGDAAFLGQLRAAAGQWDAQGRAEGLLWRGDAAREAIEWLERWREDESAATQTRSSSPLGPRELRFLRAVAAHAERSRRRRRRSATVAFAVLAAFAVIVSYLAIHAGRQATRADREAAQVRDQARRARNATRIAAARAAKAEHDATSVLALMREVEPPKLPREWAELTSWALQSGLVRAERKFPNIVYDAQFSPTGDRIAATNHNGEVYVVSADGERELATLRGHEGFAFSVAFSPDGTRIATTSADHTARVWRADGTGEPIVLRGHTGWVLSVEFSPDGTRIATSSADHTARVWRADGTGEPIVLRGHAEQIRQLSYSPDGALIVTASEDETARVWRADGTGEPAVLRGHRAAVTSAAFSPDGAELATSSRDGTVRIWTRDPTTQAWLRDSSTVLRGHDDMVYSVQYSPDGGRLVTASRDKTVRVWTRDGSSAPLVLGGHEHWVYNAVFHPDGVHIVTASADRRIRVWACDPAVRPVRYLPRRGQVLDVRFRHGHAHVATSAHNGDVHIEHVGGPGEPAVFTGHGRQFPLIRFTDDGARLALVSSDNELWTWAWERPDPPSRLGRHDAPILWAAHNRDGSLAVTASVDETARVWRTDGSRPPVVLRGHTGVVVTAVFDPEGARVVTTSNDGTARVWRADGTGRPVVLRAGDGVPFRAVFSPDGARVLVVSKDNTTRVWRADGGGEPVVFEGDVDALPFQLADPFDPEGRHIVTVPEKNAVTVWRADGGGELAVLTGPAKNIVQARFAPDGERLAIVAGETVQVWSADGSGQPFVLLGHQFGASWVGFSPDGAHMAVTAGDGSARVWRAPTPLRGLEDPRLWTATSHCMSVVRREGWLHETTDAARANREACVARSRATR